MKILITFLFLLLVITVNAGDFDDTYNLPNRDVMVHLFEWKWTDIANECENYLSKQGFGTVQISPPMEHVTLIQNNNIPWYVRYQPVSYKMISRSGTESELKDMIERCNKVGVRIIADVVLNHMAGFGQKYGVETRNTSGGSFFDATGPELFPSVPYGPNDFNDWRCNHNIENGDYGGNAANVRNCRLEKLLDLNQESKYVQDKILKYLNKLIDMGVSGFRFDASKHMWPKDLKVIQYGLKNIREDIFGKDKKPFVVHEVIDHGGESTNVYEYQEIGRYTNFNFADVVSSAIKGKINVADLANLHEGYHYGNGRNEDVLNFLDNHDNQREDPNVLTYKDDYKYKQGVAYMLAWNYGYPRVMSSYYFTDKSQGPPNHGPDTYYATKSPNFNKDLTCNPESGFVCEHRWPEIRRMIGFRSVAGNAKVTELRYGDNMLAFAREGKGFFAINNNGGEYIERNVKTTLPSGVYCDLSTGEKVEERCTGRYLVVDKNGQADLFIPGRWYLAVSIDSKL